ncbi:MAG: hypothetical protein JW741_15190 [Sedimentisphaerales bacterium]|nr:hypothetical protein [Sedimentisphaerales bacterium]
MSEKECSVEEMIGGAAHRVLHRVGEKGMVATDGEGIPGTPCSFRF